MPTLSIDLKDYKAPVPELTELAEFFDSYKQIYQF
jgi:predicted RNA-binding protein